MKSKREPITASEAKQSLHALDVMSGNVTEPRRFIIEYVDGQGRDYNRESFTERVTGLREKSLKT